MFAVKDQGVAVQRLAVPNKKKQGSLCGDSVHYSPIGTRGYLGDGALSCTLPGRHLANAEGRGHWAGDVDAELGMGVLNEGHQINLLFIMSPHN